jgi:pimeloyl-ACP methyl ester carboxylesterase
MAVRHFAQVVANSSSSTAPRLFVMRERDEFTSVHQLERMGKRMRGEEGANGGGVINVEIVPGVGHFQLERPGYDELVARMVLNWLDKIPA